jgi:hypothetical protein
MRLKVKTGSFECGNENVGSKKLGDFLVSLRTS